jgi:hypothetical protein
MPPLDGAGALAGGGGAGASLRALRVGVAGTELGMGDGRDGRGVVSRRGVILTGAGGGVLAVVGASTVGAGVAEAAGEMTPSDSATARGAATSGAGAATTASVGAMGLCRAAR